MSSAIEWTDETWNPTVGCRRVSAGCEHCYAERIAAQRLEPNDDVSAYDGVAERTENGPRWTGVVKCLPEKLGEPFSWRKPRRVFVDSMSDLFHSDVPFEFVARVFSVAALNQEHVFQILTKRPGRAEMFFAWLRDRQHYPDDDSFRIEPSARGRTERADDEAVRNLAWFGTLARQDHSSDFGFANQYALYSELDSIPWPLPNVWIGTSCENQKAANARIPPLLATPAAVRFVSAEPLIGPIDLEGVIYPDGDTRSTIDEVEANIAPPWNNATLDWIIVGGESGPDARPCRLEWIDAIVEQAQRNDVPLFVKQLGATPFVKSRDAMHPAHKPYTEFELDDDKGGDPSEWPEDLRVRQYPEVQQ